MEEEEWFLATSKKLIDVDVFAARSWLLTAKSIFPQSLRLQMEEYHLELSKSNIKECSRVLNEIFRDFANEQKVWEEIGNLIEAVESLNDPLRKAIFENLPALTQQKMILISAECRVNLTQYCKLLLILMNKFPESISQYGIPLIDKLVDTEKKESENVVNHCRKLLVREVLPVICRSGNVNVSNKHFYKWLQKSTEFYANYFTSDSEANAGNAWKELETLRNAVAIQCHWNIDEDVKGATLLGRMSFIRELFRRSRTDVDGAINRKQIFYTAIILLFEAASKYIHAIDPSFYRDSEKNDESYIVVVDVEDTDESSIESSIKRSTEMSDAFHVAKEAWTILHANEVFEKDFNHLNRRWKCERWVWFQLFLVDLLTYDGNHQGALLRLEQIEERIKDTKPRERIICRIYCHLVSTYFSLNMMKESCMNIFKCLPRFNLRDLHNSSKTDSITHFIKYPVTPKGTFPITSNSSPPQSRLKMMKFSMEQFLPFWIHIFITSLHKVSLSFESDLVLGHMMVLTQHHWPKWKSYFTEIMERINKKRSFDFQLFFNYVINIDILEEMSFIKNQNSCRLNLGSNVVTRAHVTREANLEVEDNFWNSVKQNAQRSGQNIDILLRDYLLTCENSILSTINTVAF